MIFLCLALIFSAPYRLATHVRESVDVIELNHFCDKRGFPVYDQVIFYLLDEDKRLQVRAWCIAEDGRAPVRNHQTDIYTVRWKDTDRGVERTVTSRIYRESWSQIDPERENKKYLPEGLRVSLVGRIAK